MADQKLTELPQSTGATPNDELYLVTDTSTTPQSKRITFDDLQESITHNNLAGLTTGDPHTQYALLAGRSGGQTITGGTANSNNLNLESTSGSTKGFVRMVNPDGAVAIGLDTPSAKLHIKNNSFGNNDAPSGDDDGGGYTVASAPIQSLFCERGFVGLGDTYFTPKNRLDVKGGIAVGSGYAGTYAVGDLKGILVEGKSSIGTLNSQAMLNVRGAGSSTARAFQVLNSSNSKLFVVRDDGKVGINMEPADTAYFVVNSVWTNWTASTTRYGLSIVNDITISSSAQRFYRTLNFTNEINISSGISYTGYIFGFSADVTRKNSTDSGTLQDLHAINFAFGHEGTKNSNGNTTNAYGINVRPYHAKATITNMYGLFFDGPATGGTVTNPYAIYSEWDAKSYFAGRIGIKDTTPDAELDVNQTSTTAAIPTLILNQSDLSEEFINFESTIGALNPIVASSTVSTLTHKVRVSVNGSFKYLYLYNA